MAALFIILLIAAALVYVIWRFTRPKSASYGIEVVAGESEHRNYNQLTDSDGGVHDADVEDDNNPVVPRKKRGSSRTDIEKLKSATEKECIEMIYKDPKDINAYLRLSVFYLQRQKWSDAKEVLMEALKVDPDNDKIYNNLGIVWFRLKRYNNAVTAFEKAIKFNDKVAHRYMNMGLALAALGDNEKASDYFSRAVALDPEEKNYQELLSEVKSLMA